MGRTETTAELSDALQKHLDPHNDPRIYWAKEVTFDYATGSAIRVDYMLFKPKNNTVSGIEKGDFYCYEIKSSVEDFHSKNGHNFIGDFNYYVMPMEVFETLKEQIPYGIGIFGQGKFGLQCVKKAKRKDRMRPIHEMLLMMWRSSRRDLVKRQKEERTDVGSEK